MLQFYIIYESKQIIDRYLVIIIIAPIIYS